MSSLYGFDFMDVVSRSSLMTRGRRDDAAEVVSTPATEDEDEDYLVVDDHASSTVAESADTLPSEIHLSEGESQGFTILPSVPSAEAEAAAQSQMIQALSMQVQAPPRRIPAVYHSTTSLSTNESKYDDSAAVLSPSSSVSSLSLSLSVDSSGFSEDLMSLSPINSWQAADESSAGSNSSSGDDSTAVRDIVSVQKAVKSLSSNEPWYTHLKTEADWEAFRDECMQLMGATEDAPYKSPDELLARLIAEEEEFLYPEKKEKGAVAVAQAGSLFGLSFEAIAMIAGAALVSSVSYALLRSRRTKVA
jgi:hypothetical protein